MNSSKIAVASIGNHGGKIFSKLNKMSLLELKFISRNELTINNSNDIFLLFIIYATMDNCLEEVNKVIKVYSDVAVIEIVITDRIIRQNPYYIINNLFVSGATKEILILIRAFNNLATSPIGNVDMADIIYSLKDVNELLKAEFLFEISEHVDNFGRLYDFLRHIQQNRLVGKIIWLQIYLQVDDPIHNNIYHRLLVAIDSTLDGKTDILWNVSYRESLPMQKNKCVLLY